MLQLLPWLLYRLLDHPDLPATDTSSLRRVRVGSSPVSPRRIGEAIERLGPVIGQTYGSIEATNITTIDAEELAAHPELRGTVGRPVPGVELSVRDDADREVPTGEVGRVHVRSFAVMAGYHNAPDQTADVLRDGWFDTGDLGRLDDAGYLTLVGRTKDVIFAEGGDVHPTEVEHVLVEHPDVTDAGVFAVPDDDGIERVAAVVVASRGAEPDVGALAAWVTERHGTVLAAGVHVVDAIQRVPSGKIDRAALAGRIGDRRPRADRQG